MNSKLIENFPNSGKIYLNNASVSLVPHTCIQAMNDFLIDYNSLGPDSLDSDSFVNDKLRSTRNVISQIIKCRPEELVLTQSTTDGLNIVSNGIKTNSNSNIIIRDSFHEHHANFFPWLKLGKQITLKNLGIDDNGFFKIDELEKLIDNDTKLVVLSHALYNTGAILPVEETGKILEEKNIPFCVDSAQTVGCLNVDVNSIKCDFMSFNGSKWLCGPMGTGLFYCKKSSSDLLEPKTIGGESAMIYDGDKIAFKDIPDKFQTGFRNYVGMVGLEASAKYLLQFGISNIRKKVIRLANQLRQELTRIRGISLYGPENHEKRTSIVSFNLAGIEPAELVQRLEKQNIVLAQREIFEKKIVRASPHFFNTEDDIQKVVDAIKSL